MRLHLVAVALLVGVALGCSSTTAPPTSATAAGPVATPTSRPYDSNAMMYRLLSRFRLEPGRTIPALKQVREHNDTSQVPVLVDMLRYLPYGSTRSGDMRTETLVTLHTLTGQELTGGDDWSLWMEWLGNHLDEFPPPEDYIDWKISLLVQIHPRFEDLLFNAKETSRINLTEVVWGGVIPDGIPDLQNPPNIPPEEADYLAPDERVFGVSINGEHRAYPLRITNPHEMVNDELGGEPVALAW